MLKNEKDVSPAPVVITNSSSSSTGGGVVNNTKTVHNHNGPSIDKMSRDLAYIPAF